ncbi:MAG: SRPBCC family protein [Sphingomicrobium sp.]
MDERLIDPTLTHNRTIVERKSDLEMVVTRTFDAPAHIMFEAWTKAELFRQWWVPKSFGLTVLACEMDVRVGGRYRLEFGHPASEQPMSFYGSYLEVVPDARIVWTNEESEDGAVTTVTFEEQNGKTLLAISNRFPSKEALESELASGATDGMGQTLDQLETFIVTLVK